MIAAAIVFCIPIKETIFACPHSISIRLAAITCRYRGRARCPTASCAPSACRRSTTAAPSSARSAASCSGLASADYRHDEWGVDVTVSGSQKGLMLPPGISFNALSPKAIAASKTARLPKSFWAWDEIVEMNKNGYWPYTPSTNLLYGLAEAIDMILDEGLDNVFARHQRLAEACRAAVRAWGLEIQCV